MSSEQGIARSTHSWLSWCPSQARRLYSYNLLMYLYIIISCNQMLSGMHQKIIFWGTPYIPIILINSFTEKKFSIWWPQKFLDFVKNWARGGRLKMATLIYCTVSQQLFSNAHNLGLEWTFWGFSGLKTIVWSLAFWWTHKFLNFVKNWARGGRLKMATLIYCTVSQQLFFKRP